MKGGASFFYLKQHYGITFGRKEMGQKWGVGNVFIVNTATPKIFLWPPHILIRTGSFLPGLSLWLTTVCLLVCYF